MGLGTDFLILLAIFGLLLWLLFLAALAAALLGIQFALHRLLPGWFADRRQASIMAAVLLLLAIGVTAQAKRTYDRRALATAKVQLSHLCTTLARPIVRGTMPAHIDVISIKGFREPVSAAIGLKKLSRERGLIRSTTEYEGTTNSFGDAMFYEPDRGSKGQRFQSGPARARYQLEQVKGKNSVNLADLAGFNPTHLTLTDNHGFLLRDLSNNQIVAQRHFPTVLLAAQGYHEECKGPNENGSPDVFFPRLGAFVAALN